MYESGGTRKTGLARGLLRAPYARIWQGPRKIIKFGIGGDAFPTVLRGLLGLFSLFLVDLL